MVGGDRLYEPDAMKMTSTGELESSEKNLMDTLTRVMQRKEYLMNKHVSSSYDPSGITSLDNVGWLGEGGDTHSHMFDPSVSLDPITSTVYEAFSQGGATSNVECHVSNESNNSNMQAWPPGYSMYPSLQQEIVAPDMQEMNQMMQQQLNNAGPMPSHFDFDPSKAPH